MLSFGKDKDVTVGVLSLHNSKETKAILNAVDDLGHEPVWLREENIEIRADEEGVEIEPDVDVIANRLLLSSHRSTEELVGLAESMGNSAEVLNPGYTTQRAAHKFTAYSRLSKKGIPIPKSYFSLFYKLVKREISDIDGEFVQKVTFGSHGDGTLKQDGDSFLSPRMGDNYSVIQEIINNDKGEHYDVRVYVVGGNVIGAMKRTAPEDDWRTNVSRGGGVEEYNLSDEMEKISKEATDAIGLDYAGVDLVRDSSKDKWYVLEVNPTAGFRGFYRATGTSPAPYIAAQAIKKAGGSVDWDEVKEISRELDDSPPKGKPSFNNIHKTQELGLIEEIRLSGSKKSMKVKAKSDTGASRTSIDTTIAAEIGAGPIEGTVKIKTGSYDNERVRPLVSVIIGVGDNEHEVVASVEDRSHMDQDVLLGRDVLQHYSVNIDKEDATDDGEM